jgi:predicted RNA-binding Zn ribbon-like protein
MSATSASTSPLSRPTDHRGRFIPDGGWPAGRGAPEPLERVRRFLNTVNPESGADHFETPASLAAWTEREGYDEVRPITEAQRMRMVELRAALRELAHGNHAPSHGGHDLAATVAVLDDLAARLPVLLRFAPGAGLVPTSSGVDALVTTILAIVHEAMVIGTWSRLKACRNHHCRWAFYDHSRNASGAWCSLEACGSRMKVRAYRARRAGRPMQSASPSQEGA